MPLTMGLGRRCVACLTLLVCTAAPAFAQAPRSARPYRGLFGGSAPTVETPLTLTASVGGGYDTNVLLDPSGAGTTPIGDPRQSQGGGYGTLTAGLNYTISGTRTSFAASASSAGRYYPDLSDFIVSHSGAVGGSVRIARNTQVSLNQSITYQPFLTIDLFPQLGDPTLGLTPPAAQDRGTISDDYLTYGTLVDLTQTLSRRASLEFSYQYQLSDFTGGRNLSTQMGLGRFRYLIGRGLGVRLGYGHTEWTYPELTTSGGRIIDRRLDAGVDFARALSLSRRTTLAFDTGVAAVADQLDTYYRFVGNARLVHELGRTWNATAVYARELGVLQRIARPIFSNAFTVGVGGLANRRVQLQSNVGVTLGDVGLTADASGFDTYSANVSATTGLTRYLALAVTYSFYRYSFGSSAVLPVGLPSDFDRHSVEASLNVWAPLLQRVRRANAAR